MKIHFSIEYRTKWGEDIRVMLIKNDTKALIRECPLETYDGIRWEGEIAINKRKSDYISYKYALYSNDKLVWTEWEEAPHTVIFNEGVSSYFVDDIWRPIPAELPLYSSAYTNCIAPHDDVETKLNSFDEVLQLRTVEPRLRTGEYLAVIGNTAQLGNWETPVRMSLIALQEWGLNLDASLIYKPVEYKYVIVNSNNKILQWEEGVNRKIRNINLQLNQAWIKNDEKPNFKIQNWKCAGIVIPVFSLRSENSYGIGDFGDLKSFIVWAASTSMHAVQILPINDTTMSKRNSDSYPYSAISIYALHPIYCNLEALGTIKSRLKMEEFLIQRQKLNDCPYLMYEEVYKLKEEYIREMYKQNGKDVMKSEEFKKFYDDNAYWLKPYAAFCYLRDKYNTPDFSKWQEYSKYSAKKIDAMCEPKSELYHEVALHFYTQYNLHLQLQDVRQCARKNKVIIKGDIPIGINRNSVEAWTEPYYFNIGQQAGAPPDDFSVNGQNWGFPTYNWKGMEKDNYAWWSHRFEKMSEYFDAYRIDHVLGFFRIWSIPLSSVHGLLGQFSPSIPMSANEIESFGIKFRYDLMVKPFINDETLDKFFGYKKEMIKLLYLNHKGDGMFEMKTEYNTQRKIEAAFCHKNDEESIKTRDGLYSLVSNVLFVQDMNVSTMYHPRITAQYTTVYESLSTKEKRAFDSLYEEYYYHRHNNFWYEQAMNKLPRLTQATRMLVCAEDLGMVPECVPWVMEQLRILSLEIQTMPKAYGLEFGLLQNNPYLSVATISTHDMPTLRMWWEEDYDRAQRYYNKSLNKDGLAPRVLPGWLSEDIINRYLFCPSMLCLLSFQDWLAMDESIRNPDAGSERINVPADPNHYWCWRMHLKIEDLMKAKFFNERIKTLISYSGRK